MNNRFIFSHFKKNKNGILILIFQIFIVKKIILKISFFKFKMCANITLAGKLGIGFGNHRINNSLLLDVFTVVVMDIDLSDNEVNIHSVGNEASFVLTSGSGEERIESFESHK